MPELSAATLAPQLKRLDRQLQRRARRREVVADELHGRRGVRLSPHHDPADAVALSVIFDDTEQAQCFAGNRGVHRLIETGRHVYTNWQSVLGRRELRSEDGSVPLGAPRRSHDGRLLPADTRHPGEDVQRLDGAGHPGAGGPLRGSTIRRTGRAPARLPVGRRLWRRARAVTAGPDATRRLTGLCYEALGGSHGDSPIIESPPPTLASIGRIGRARPWRRTTIVVPSWPAQIVALSSYVT